MGDNTNYPTGYMTQLAQTKQSKWETEATLGVEKVRDGIATQESFGQIPSLAKYAATFEQARREYTGLMRGAKLDLEAVADGIKKSAKQMQDNDDRAGEAFLALWSRWENGPLQSTQNRQEAGSTPEAQEAAQTVNDAQAPADGDSPQEVPTGGDEVPTGGDEVPTGGDEVPTEPASADPANLASGPETGSPSTGPADPSYS
ncbi:hypothetical protein BCF74_11924 [Knoellia remsis]|uniref:Uncharacterized protein n=1 Tax=Knoellia remsis TaxID=407159 RepID=A0A2T0UER1_9MICO|nr:hypothetical protein [Knoellia remsis]PRY56307.1 hypothetical protein BCF74_11924 [Knoellia remsis]